MGVNYAVVLGKMSDVTFLEHQHIEFENALSYKTRVDADKLMALLEFIRRNADALGLEITGSIVFTISDTYSFADRCIFDIEVLVPVNKAFPSTERYIYKPVFRLVNAVSLRVGGNTRGLMNAKEKLAQYISSHRLNAISGIYYSAVSSGAPDIESFDALVSINDNMV